MSDTNCVLCGEPFKPEHFYDEAKTKPVDTGYGVRPDGEKVCFSCCGKTDAEELRTTGRLVGYFTYSTPGINHARSAPRDQYVGSPTFTNWPGTLKISTYTHVRVSRNNFGATRLDFWFTWEGRTYHGVNIGDNQIARVRRVKGA